MEGKRQLYDAEVRGEMAAVDRDGPDDRRSQLLRQFPEFLRLEFLDIGRRVDLIEYHQFLLASR